ncbi:MAG: lamin tail domain-containing protein [Patescibacteria group bacterium]
MHYFSRATICTALFLPVICFGQVLISEVMYDVSGTDSGREWIELQNTGSTPVDLTSLKLFEANTNHSLVESQGSATLAAGGFAIIADDPAKFKVDWPNFAGVILNSSFSLSNEGEAISIKDGDVVIDQVSYSGSLGAAGDGKSLVRNGSTFSASTPSPGAGITSDTTTSSDGGQTTSSSNTTTAGSTSNTSSPNTTTSGTSQTASVGATIPQIYADAGEDVSGVTGASLLFSGKAYGLKKELLVNARLIWNFGDGAIAEGLSVLHTYALPGTYTVFLDVASGQYSAVDKKVVTIVPSALTIGTIVKGVDGYATITNGTAVELDLSRWYLKNDAGLFLLPAHTVVSPRGTLSIPNNISGLFVTDSTAELLYPNGEVAHQYLPIVPKASTVGAGSESSTPTSQAITTKAAVSEKNLRANQSQVATVASAEAFVEGSDTEVLSVPRKSDSVAVWMLGLSGFVALIFGGMWFAHKKGITEKKEEPSEEEDDFEIIH